MDYGKLDGLGFNPRESNIMHIDLNSCFATIEQQANPLLRDKPIAVAPYTGPSGCIIAPSIEAKRLGIKTGMKVKEGKMLYPRLIILPPDPDKYRSVHLSLRRLISNYTVDFAPKSIDEFTLNLQDYLSLRLMDNMTVSDLMHRVGREIKERIKKEIGEVLTVSIGIGPSRFLAKLASNLHKPNGLDEINKNNFWDIYKKVELRDLNGINYRNELRLNTAGIFTVSDFFNAPIWKLKSAFSSILGYYWYLRLRGWEIDDVEFGRKSYGNSYVLPEPLLNYKDLSPILTKLVEKMSMRMRNGGYKTKGISLALVFANGLSWHKRRILREELFDTQGIYKEAFRTLAMFNSLSLRKNGGVKTLAVSCFNLTRNRSTQLNFFEDKLKRQRLTLATDVINKRWGAFSIIPARMLPAEDAAPDRIAFGSVSEIEEFINRSL